MTGPSASGSPHRRGLLVAGLLVALAAGVLLALTVALGGSGTGNASAAGAAATDPVSPAPSPVPARHPPGSQGQEGTGGAPPLKACSLVTRAEVAAATGRAIAQASEAPLGPTCVYQPADGGDLITLTVQNTKLADLQRDKRAIGSRPVGNRTAVCVSDGSSEQTLIGLPDDRVLAIRASCAAGAGMAARALPRL